MPLNKRYLLACLCGVIMTAGAASAAGQEPSPTEPPISPASALDRQNRLLAQEFPAAATWLTAGTEEFLALWQPWSSSQQKGVVLMLPAQGHTANGWGSFSYLRRNLPERGWATLSIALPAADIPAALRLSETPPEEQAEAAEEQAAATKAQAEQQAEQQIQTGQRIAAAVAFLQQRAPGQQMVLLGENTGAAHGMAYFDSLPGAAPVSAVVLLDARNSLPGRDFTLIDALAEQTLPVLDIFTKQAPNNIADAEARKNAAEINQLSAYRQVQPATSAPFTALPTQATKYVEGFLRSLSEE